MNFVFGNKTVIGDRQISPWIKDLDICIFSIYDTDSLSDEPLEKITFTRKVAEELYEYFCQLRSFYKGFNYDLPLTSTTEKYSINCYLSEEDTISFNIVKKIFNNNSEIVSSFVCTMDDFNYFADVWFWYYIF